MGCIKSTPVHPSSPSGAGSFSQTDMHWLDPEFDDAEQKKIVKPDKIKLKRPPHTSDEIDRIKGSMLGLALGDALGANVEFRPHQYLIEHPVSDLKGGGTWGLDAGQFTDDTSMSLCLAISLIVSHGWRPYDQLVRYKWWYRIGYMSSTGKCFDIGAATKNSLLEFERRQRLVSDKSRISIEELDHTNDPKIFAEIHVHCGQKDAAGNGSLMRLAPVPLFFYHNPQIAVQYSGESSLTTHGDRQAYDACRLYGALIVAALRGESREQLLDGNFYKNHRRWFGDEGLIDKVKEIAEGSFKVKGGHADGIRGKGFVLESLRAALWAFWSDEGSFEKGVLAAVNLGDDTDTTAAIYGQLAGACYGYEKLPERWTKQIYAQKFIRCLSDWIAYEGERWFHQQQSTSTTRPQSKL